MDSNVMCKSYKSIKTVIENRIVLIIYYVILVNVKIAFNS